MSYRDEYHPKVKSDLRKFDKAVIKELFDVHIEKILQEPHLGEKLHGELEGVSSYHFRKNKVEYRGKQEVIYENKRFNCRCF